MTKYYLLLSLQVVDWIIGPGEKLLGSQKEIGNNFKAADQFRREHEKLELKCTVSVINPQKKMEVLNLLKCPQCVLVLPAI